MNEYVVILDSRSNRDNEELLYVKKALVVTEETPQCAAKKALIRLELDQWIRPNVPIESIFVVVDVNSLTKTVVNFISLLTVTTEVSSPDGYSFCPPGLYFVSCGTNVEMVNAETPLQAVQQHKYMKRYFNGDRILTSSYGHPHVITLTVYDHRGNTHTVTIKELLTMEVLDDDSND